MKTAYVWWVLAVAIAPLTGAAAGCGGGSGEDLGPGPLTVAKPTTQSGDQQSGPVNSVLDQALRVVVTRDGVPESGVSVAWSAGQGSVSPSPAPTNSDGVSATTWTLGSTTGAQMAQAEVVGAVGSPVGFSATATEAAPPPGPPPPPPPPPSTLMLAKTAQQSGDAQTGPVNQPLAQELRVIVTRDGAPQAGVTVVWSTEDGSLDPASEPTNGDGISAVAWTLGATTGSQTARAEVAGATGSPVIFTATATATQPPPPPPPPGPPTSIAVTVGNIFFRSDRNQTSNPAVDTVAVNGTVTWTWVATGTVSHSVESEGSPSFPSSAILSGNGKTYSFRFTQAGTYTYECAVHGNSMTGRVVVR
jgi:plastocyanin